MANPNDPPEPPPAISAAELRRRLLASTPPPVAPAATIPLDPDDLAALPTPGQQSRPDLMARLRMPPAAAHTPPPHGSHPELHATPPASVNRRTPIVGMRSSGLDSSAVGAAQGNPYYGGPPPGTSRTPIANPVPPARTPGGDYHDGEVHRLRNENKELRHLLEEMKHLLQEASDNEQQAANREAEIRDTLVEKQQQLDDLSAQMQSIEDQIASGELTTAQPRPRPSPRPNSRSGATNSSRRTPASPRNAGSSKTSGSSSARTRNPSNPRCERWKCRWPGSVPSWPARKRNSSACRRKSNTNSNACNGATGPSASKCPSSSAGPRT